MIINKPICQICGYQAIGVFRNKWICGECLLKFENKIRQQNDRVLDIIEKEMREENKT